MTADTTRFKRIHYRSWHRGCKETDLVLGDFADKGLAGLSPELLDIYEKLLDENDIDIWNWLTGHEAPPEYRLLLDILRDFGGQTNDARH
jgi:antitoxin CptB